MAAHGTPSPAAFEKVGLWRKLESPIAAVRTAAEQGLGNALGNTGNASSTVGRRNVLTFQEVFGAGDRDRTDDIQLGKLTFYH